MASGCIFGTCWVCNELVWEDEAEYDFDNNLVVHKRCLKLLKARKRIIELESEGIEC